MERLITILHIAIIEYYREDMLPWYSEEMISQVCCGIKSQTYGTYFFKTHLRLDYAVVSPIHAAFVYFSGHYFDSFGEMRSLSIYRELGIIHYYF